MKTIKQQIAEKEEARMEKKIKAMNKENKDREVDKVPKKRGRKKNQVISNPETTEETNVDRECFPYNMGRNTETFNQSAKADCGKPQLSLVPMKILTAIARVREYGNKKYKSKDNWKTVEAERYMDAAFRHWVKFVENPSSIDEESGLKHLWHVACNIAFLIEMDG